MDERPHNSDWPLSPERMADVLECLPAGLVVVDEDGRITYCNRLGNVIREVGERAGEPVANRHPPRTHAALSQDFEELKAQDPAAPHPIVVERRNRWEITYSRITDRQGQFRGVAWMAHDIKNPLCVITGAVHNLRATCPVGEMAEILSLIAEQG